MLAGMLAWIPAWLPPRHIQHFMPRALQAALPGTEPVSPRSMSLTSTVSPGCATSEQMPQAKAASGPPTSTPLDHSGFQRESNGLTYQPWATTLNSGKARTRGQR